MAQQQAQHQQAQKLQQQQGEDFSVKMEKTPESEYNIAITSLVNAGNFQQTNEASETSSTTALGPSIKKHKKRIVLEVLSVVYGENNQPVRVYYIPNFIFYLDS